MTRRALPPDHLTRAVRAYRDRRVSTAIPDQRFSGAMAAVRDHLPLFEKLRTQDGASWADIAAALSEIGVRQRDGTPITPRRLTALVASVRREAERRAATAERRRSRADLPLTKPDGFATTRPKPSRGLGLSPDLDPVASADPVAQETIEERRRARFENAKTLLKKG